MNVLYRNKEVYPQIDDPFRCIDIYNRKASLCGYTPLVLSLCNGFRLLLSVAIDGPIASLSSLCGYNPLVLSLCNGFRLLLSVAIDGPIARNHRSVGTPLKSSILLPHSDEILIRISLMPSSYDMCRLVLQCFPSSRRRKKSILHSIEQKHTMYLFFLYSKLLFILVKLLALASLQGPSSNGVVRKNS